MGVVVDKGVYGLSRIYVTFRDGLVIELGGDVWRHIVARHLEL